MAVNDLQAAFEAAKKEAQELGNYIGSNLVSELAKAVQKASEFKVGNIDSTSINAMISSYQKLTGGLDSYAQKLEAIKTIQEKLNVTATQAANIYNNEALSQQKLEAQVAKTASANEARAARAEQAAQREALSLKNLAPAYVQLQKEIQAAQYQYLQLAASGKASSDEAQNFLRIHNEGAAKMALYTGALGQGAKATGNMAYATNSLTMIMSELPNFAISSRIGIMSLSNNISPLLLQFKALKEELGSGMAALKTFGASLLSVNTIAMVAVTLFTAYGEEIVKWVEDLWDGVQGLDALTKSQKYYNDAVQDSKGNWAKQSTDFLVLKAALTQASNSLKEGSSAFKDFSGNSRSSIENAPKLVKAWTEIARVANLMKTTMGDKMKPEQQKFLESLDKVTTIKGGREAIGTLQSLFNEYQPLIESGYAASDATKKIAEEITALKQAKEKLKDNTFKEVFGNFVPTSNQISKFEKEANRIYSIERAIKEKQIKEFNATGNPAAEAFASNYEGDMFSKSDLGKFRDNLTDKQKEMLKYKNGLAEINKNISEKTVDLNRNAFEMVMSLQIHHNKNREGQMRDLYIKEYEYIHEIAVRKQENINLEDSINEYSLTKGRNNLETRLEATTKYYQNLDRIAELEKQKQKKDASEEFNQTETRIKNSKQTESDKAKDREVNANNLKLKLLKIEDDYDITVLTNTKARANKVIEITKNQVDYEIKELQRRAKETSVESEQKYYNDKIDLLKSYNRSLNDVFTGENSEYKLQQSLADLEHENNLKKIEDEYSTADKKYKISMASYDAIILNEKSTDKERIQAAKNREDAINEFADAGVNYRKGKQDEEASYAIKKEEEENQKKIDLRNKEVETINTFYSSVTSIIDAYYSHVSDKIEEERTLNSDRKEEALADLDDRYKAGAKAADGELLTKAKYEKEKARLTAYYEGVDKNLQEEKKKAEKEQFMFDKAVAIAQIATNTAVAVTSVMAKNPALIPWIIAMGAMQEAVVVAQMIAYKDGTKGTSKDEIALTNDGRDGNGNYVREVIQRPGEKPFLQSGINTITFLPKGSKVWKNEYEFQKEIGVDSNLFDNSNLYRSVINMNVRTNDSSSIVLSRLLETNIETNRILKNKNLIIKSSLIDRARMN